MKWFLLAITSLLVTVDSMAIDDSTIRDMPFVTTTEFCLECHTREESLAFRDQTSKSCSVYCLTCHKTLKSHHGIDRYLSGTILEGIALLNGKIACFTCHDLRKNRQDTVSWKAESLYESLFQRNEIYPTYFLIEKNNDGQLCKKCH